MCDVHFQNKTNKQMTKLNAMKREQTYDYARGTELRTSAFFKEFSLGGQK